MADLPQRVLVVLPTWVGDCVMATPLLRAIRLGLPQAHVAGLARASVAGVMNGLPFLDALSTSSKDESLLSAARRLRASNFDAAILLPGSFKTALLARLARIPRRIGYARDGRGPLLTDALVPPMTGRWPRRDYAVTPTLPYYLKLLEILKIPEAGRHMELAVTDDERATADRVLASAGIELGERPFVLLNPGASYGAAKLWPPEHYAAVADRFAAEWNAVVAASVAPTERGIVEQINRHAANPVADLAGHGLTLGAVKELCRRADLVVTNDTGTRHVAAAMGTRVVTVFGPTDPRWTTLHYERERELSVPVPCGPCQRKVCPLESPRTKQCLWKLTPAMVFEAGEELMRTTAVRLPVVASTIPA